MSITKTLRISPGVVSQTGNIQMQPVTNTPESDAKNSVSQTSSNINSISLASNANLSSIVTVNNSNGNLDVSIGASISSVINSLKQDSGFSIHGSTSIPNRLSPSYGLSDNLNSLISPSRDLSNGITKSRGFKSVDVLSGISSARPEIVMLTQFKPLFNTSFDAAISSDSAFDVNDYTSLMTDAGLYLDTQIKSRQLKLTNVRTLLQGLSTNNSGVLKLYQSKNKQLQTHIDSLRETHGFLLNMLKKIQELQLHLDIRHSIHDVDPQETIRQYLTNHTQSSFNFLASPLVTQARQSMPITYDTVDVLVKLGYDRNAVLKNFTSTKIWMQLLLEYKNILKYHSLEFLDIDPVVQKSDTNAITITTPDVNYFSISDENVTDLLSLNEISALPADSLRSITSTIQNAFLSIYSRGAHFKSPEARVAALLHVFSREYKYSINISKTPVINVLKDKFSYNTTQTDNTGVFDIVIGENRNSVLNFPTSETKSLVGISQRLPTTNTAVLTFESDYIDGLDGTITPGSEYFVSSAIVNENAVSFDTNRIKSLSSLMRSAHTNLSSFLSTMNILSTSDIDPQRRTETMSTIANAPALLKMILDSFVDRSSGNTKNLLLDDILGSVFAHAATNVSMKSLLFLYIISRLSRAYSSSSSEFSDSIFTSPLLADNTPLADAIVAKIIEVLESSTKNTIGFNSRENSTTTIKDLYPETIDACLKIGTPLIREIEKLMSAFFDTLNRLGGLAGSRTRYSGMLDTTLMMTAFDAIISIIGQYSNQSITGRQSAPVGNGIVYTVKKSVLNHKIQINDLQRRLDSELALTQQISYAILSVLSSTADSAESYVNYITSPESVAKLTAISNIIDDGKKVKLMFQEQQAMLFSSIIQDVIVNLETADKNGDIDLDDNGRFDVNDEIKLIDEIASSSKIKNALLSAFGTSEFTDVKAFNKKILTVGIPVGFASKLKKRLTLKDLVKSDRGVKQRDIVRVCVYKIDMLNQDIVYKPKKFLFELSRFVVRNDKQIKFVNIGSNISSLASAIPTRDFGESSEENGYSVSYWNPSQESLTNKANAMNSKSYDFLSISEKAQVIKNHTYSFLLESYIKVMTGLSVGEQHFELSDVQGLVAAETLGPIIDNHMKSMLEVVDPNQTLQTIVQGASNGSKLSQNDVSPTGGIVFGSTFQNTLGSNSKGTKHNVLQQPRLTSISGLAGFIDANDHAATAPAASKTPKPTLTNNSSTPISNLSIRMIPAAIQSLKVISEFSKMQSSLSDGLRLSKKLLTPRQFDRVFNVVIDPDEFEIDYDKTVETEFGKEAMKLLIDRGDVVSSALDLKTRLIRLNLPLNVQSLAPSTTSEVGNTSDVNNFRYRDRNRIEGDLMFEKYFVTIESYDEE